MKKYLKKIRKIKSQLKPKEGFTLIEVMVSITLFLIIVTAGMSSLLNASALHQKSQDMRSIMDSLSFIMDDMGRNLRTGYTYYCASNASNLPNLVTSSQSCANGKAIGFINTFGNQWAYKIEADSNGKYNVYADTGSGFVQLNPSEVVLNSASGFSVLGAESFNSGNQQQPLVTIRLEGTITDGKNHASTPFALQTSVSQRLIDN